MSESDAISRSPRPLTAASLASGVRALGVRPGDVLLVRSPPRGRRRHTS
jgi:hypothetical protein